MSSQGVRGDPGESGGGKRPVSGTDPTFGPETGFGDDVTVAGCPNRAQLELFAAGASDASHVSAHLPVCPVCREIVRQLQANNALVSDYVAANRGRLDRSSSQSNASSAAPSGPLDDPDVASSADVVPGFRVDGEIHRGAQGVVYRAEQLSTRRKVALKTLLQGRLATSQQRLRFDREVEVVASLRHPNIVTLFESGHTRDGLAFFAMELVDGRPLSEVLKAVDRLPLDSFLRMYVAIVKAIAYAHQRGVIHRDLKPANILIDEESVPHVLDFGLARTARGDETQEAIETTAAGEFLGTFAYAAPEQLKGDPDQIDVRTDVFALGVILYEMLVNERPWQLQGRVSIADLLMARLEQAPKPPSSLRPGLDADLDVIALKCLKSEPLERYQTATALAEDVERFLDGKTILARPDSTMYFARKWIARHRAATALASIAALVGVAFVIAIVVVSLFAMQNALRASKTLKKFRETLRLASQETGVGSVDMPLGEFLTVVASNAVERADEDLEVAANAVNTVNGILQPKTKAQTDLFESQVADGRKIAERLAAERGKSDIPEMAEALHNLGRSAFRARRFTEAEDYYRQALGMYERIYGRDAIENTLTMRHLATTLTNCGLRESDPVLKAKYFDEATSLSEREYNAYGAAKGKEAERAAAQNVLAYVYEARGDNAGALTHFERSAQILRDAGVSSGDYRVGRVTFSIEKQRRRVGKPGQPIKDLRAALDALERKMGVGDPTAAEGHTELAGAILRTEGDAAEALTHAQTGLATAPTVPVRATAAAFLGCAQLQERRVDDARASFALAIRTATSSDSDAPRLVPELRALIAKSLDASGLRDDAEQFRATGDVGGS